MPNIILSDTSARVSELKKNPMAIVSAGDGYLLAIQNRNQPAFYCVPAELYEKMLDTLDDHELVNATFADFSLLTRHNHFPRPGG